MTKFIVVTGASKGIGLAAVDALVDDGWSVSNRLDQGSSAGGNGSTISS
jgi:NAD(P)-dependent dehydrogenase (short-subunit alcohol dehydrogenase family)